jgi:ABC-2 type transport system ATP-binding protein
MLTHESASREFAIDTRGLTKQFDRQIVVNDVDLQVAAGEVYGLIGPNGAGKTTLIRMLATAEEPSFGEIYLHGEKMVSDSAHRRSTALKRRLGYLPDDYPLYEDLTVWGYLEYFARLYHLREPQRSRRLLEVLNLVNLAHKKDSSTASLSRGMKQRLSLARTIIHQPILLLLDEPVSGLDPIARLEFRTIIKTLHEAGMTILISSHVLSDLAEFCTSIGVMELGFLVESAPLQEIYRRSCPQLRLSTLGDPESLINALKHYPGVDGWEVLPKTQQVQVQFAGGLEAQAELLRSLVAQGIALYEFQTVQEDLESIFLRLGHQQTS